MLPFISFHDQHTIRHISIIRSNQFILCLSVHRLVAKYRPTMPILAVIFPREGSDPSKWRSYGTTQVTCMSMILLSFMLP